MKKIISISVILLFVTSVNSQILTNSVPANAILGSNAFLDASSNYSSISGEVNSNHKGLVFPDVNLATFQFENIIADGATFPSYYDGMVVYNTTNGNTLNGVNSPSLSVAVTPGFYYFSNPNGAVNSNVTSGQWMSLGNNASKNITATSIATSITIDGAPVYAIKGTFITDGTTAITTIVPPTGITGVYRITIYKTEVSADSATAGNLITRKLASEVYDFNLSLQVNNVVTGKNPFTEVYPAGTYNYTLEYFK